MSHTSNDQIRWNETPWGTTKVFIANTIWNKGIPPRTIELCEIIWSNWSEMEDYNSFCIGPMSMETKQGQGLRGMLLQGPLWAPLTSSLLPLGKPARNPLGWCLWFSHSPRTLILCRQGLEWRFDQCWAFRMRTMLEPYNHMMML